MSRCVGWLSLRTHWVQVLKKTNMTCASLLYDMNLIHLVVCEQIARGQRHSLWCMWVDLRKDNVSSPCANPPHHFSWRSRKERNGSWALALVWVKCQCHNDQYILSYCISVICLADVGRSSSHAVRWPTQISDPVRILSHWLQDHDNGRPSTCLTAWCKTSVLEPRPNILPYSSCDGYPSSGMAKKKYCSVALDPVVILQVKDERLCTT